jgi:hypothetical protein
VLTSCTVFNSFKRRYALSFQWYSTLRASSGAKFTERILDFCFALATSTATAQGNEASSSSFAQRATLRCKLGTCMGRWNYYAVRRGYNCGLYFNWHDYERHLKGFSSAQFRGF